MFLSQFESKWYCCWYRAFFFFFSSKPREKNQGWDQIQWRSKLKHYTNVREHVGTFTTITVRSQWLSCFGNLFFFLFWWTCKNHLKIYWNSSFYWTTMQIMSPIIIGSLLTNPVKTCIKKQKKEQWWQTLFFSFHNWQLVKTLQVNIALNHFQKGFETSCRLWFIRTLALTPGGFLLFFCPKAWHIAQFFQHVGYRPRYTSPPLNNKNSS